MGVCQSQTGVKTTDATAGDLSTPGKNVTFYSLTLSKGSGGKNGPAGGEITSIDQLKFEKASFITKGNEKFRDNYIIGS